MKRARRAPAPYDVALVLRQCYASGTRAPDTIDPAKLDDQDFLLWWLCDMPSRTREHAPAPRVPFAYASPLQLLQSLSAWTHVRVGATELRAWISSCLHARVERDESVLTRLARLTHGASLALAVVPPLARVDDELAALPTWLEDVASAAPDARAYAVKLLHRRERRVGEVADGAPARPHSLTQPRRQALLGAANVPLDDQLRDLLLLAQLHCYLNGVVGFDFGARALWFESELPRLRAQGAFPVLVHRRERYEVRLNGRASDAFEHARAAARVWLHFARALSPLDGRYDLSGI